MMMMMSMQRLALSLLIVFSTSCAFTSISKLSPRFSQHQQQQAERQAQSSFNDKVVFRTTSLKVVSENAPPMVEAPEDAVITIKPDAMTRLRELRAKKVATDGYLVLRMGVRTGGCSGLSYVMDFSTEDSIGQDDQIDEYPNEGIKCVVDAKSMLYLFGLELDYSDELVGGGFKFFNPNAQKSCGCGTSFGV